MWVIFEWLPYNFEFLNPLEETVEDFVITDIIYSRGIRNEPPPDTNIVIVNIGNHNRALLAEQINRINEFEPKIIAIDAFFRSLKNPMADSMLAEALAKTKNLVLISETLKYNEESNTFDSLGTSHPMFNLNARTGFANLVTEGKEEFKSARIFSPKEMVNGKIEHAFGVEIAMLAYPEQTKKFLNRNNENEIINYTGNKQKYFVLDAMDLLDGRPIEVSLKDKIVLMGFMGENFNLEANTIQDKFFTPLNKKYVGKTYPDMFGIVVHANIVTMIEREVFIDEWPEYLGIIIGVLLCFVNVVMFYYVHDNLPSWYDLIVKFLQLLETIFLLFIVILFYQEKSLKIDLTLGITAVLLSGDLLEVYTGVLLNIPNKTKKIVLKLFKVK
jgi:CHASE2 domain-containing sensor protein